MNSGTLISFFAGVASVLSPCVIPLIPVVVGYSVLEKETSHTFVLGFFSVFTAMIFITAVLTAAVNIYIYYFRVAAAIIIILTGIYFILNKKFFNISYKPVKHRNKGVQSFLMGFITSLAWSPCYSPYLIAIIAYSASSGDVAYSTLNLAIYAAGFSFTIFIISLLTSKINLNRLIRYSKYVMIVSGLIILTACIYMLQLLI